MIEFLDHNQSHWTLEVPLDRHDRVYVSWEQLSTRPSPTKWSIGEILAHLAEDEVATAWRYRQIIEHNGIELDGFDQDLWARLGNYASRLRRSRSHNSVCFAL